MAVRVIVHIHNEDPFVAEVDALPDPSDNFVMLRNPRRKDGKSLTFVTTGATAFLYPWSRVSFIEVMDGTATHENIVGFFRDDSRGSRP
ncbi:MAG TPA: hypothetical protein VMU89_17530 [Thermomicrobiaceae bacterium]|nr:hypothetical protein [Thermomicrobiaceae bacterium]